jgi:peptidoglycan hydrolase-like protein with peptidoglycan-binding domain
MEFAAYVYDAWAYEQAHQKSPDMNLDVCPEFYFDKSQVDRLTCMLSPIKKLPYLASVLSAIAVTGIGNLSGNLQPVIAANQLAETAVNVAPWCENLYLCNTSYVLEIQTLLAKRGFDVGELDGVYGRYTKQAVINFQKSQPNLVVDGIPGGKTLALLRNSSGVASTKNLTGQNTPNNSQLNSQASNQNNNSNISDRGGQPVIVTNNPQITESGDMGNLQMLLKQRGFYRGEIDGQKGQSTIDAIAKAQRAYGLVADGFAGPLTIRALLAGGNDIALAQPMFKRSPKNQDVLEIQKLLKERGFYDEALNGLYNLQTKASIFQAQLAYAQSATGEVSPELITALKAQNLDQEVAQNPVPNAPINAPANSPPNNGQANVQNNQNTQEIRPSPNSSQSPSSGQNAPAPPQKSSNSS